ncbi:hypothetical protein HYH02_009022 [Chlamydomonas schloesseri]|uniref:Flagellar associated protein n=1 Tax=Chlamydomonas schloesseri TaxID=2026947 RepID=A0A836B0D3_9CHLO|nr:hypothetical protein HYH02_009022 [Chlamydomonas schloesseri]|eukprot:KAG2444080.1 hypothetical protein HYH02_009022 [Chlamydomonas schloesseri]
MVHKGPNQAGNKGLLTYNNTVGIPGYTGFMPSTNALALPVKGFEHTGRPAATTEVEKLTVKTVDPRKNTQYADDYHKKPADTKAFSKTGGGYWISQRVLPPHTAFTATTTYRAETLNAENNTAAILDRSQGLANTLVGYEAARQAGEARRSISADPRIRAENTARGIGTQTVLGRPGSGGAASILATAAPASPQAASSVMVSSLRRPPTIPTKFGELPGYQTTYGNMTDKMARTQADNELNGTGSFAPQNPGDPRFKTLPRVMNPGMGRNYSSYAAEYGSEGHDPMARQAPNKDTMTRISVTRDLAGGTTRNVSHIPRYTGHIPTTAYPTPEARAQGEAAEPRPDHKSQALTYTLDQYPRGRLPGYTGYKCQSPHNIDTSLRHTTKLPCHGTTSGDATLRGTQFGVPPQDHGHYINSRAGLMTFFSNSVVGTEFVSDNGLFNAQVYYKEAKSQGVLGIKTGAPSKLTHYGAPFRAAASMV